ncbi:MAG TPA: hypothetical protein VMG10_36215 [Gemmataceae bacterium]|nr:hypothetical protein [Gemmataceae bacterium]
MAASKPPNAAASDAHWRELTWDDLEEWTDSRSLERGRSYQRSGHVRDLALSADGVLLAWVQGTERYATQAQLITESDERVRPSSRCTCPLGIDGCKHGVAVVLAYLEALKQGQAIPLADAEDRRWRRLRDIEVEEADEEDFDDEEEDWEEEERTPARRPRERSRKAAQTGRTRKSKESGNVREYLEGLSAAELAAYLAQMAEHYPEVARELKNRAALSRGETGELVRQARKEIRRLTSQSAWCNAWTGEGELPDYSDLKHRFEQLLANGQADALLELGEILFEAGNQQVESSDDEGETASGIADCLTVVFQAVPASNLPDPRKLLYSIDMMMRDEYDICHDSETMLDRPWPAAAWSETADELTRRLRALPKPKANDFNECYQRDKLTNWLIHCLSNAGRDEEILPLCEEEARLTHCYPRLVEHLIEAGRLEEAKRWAREGIERTEKHWVGIAQQLREQMRELAEREGDWGSVAAMRAEEFFKHPSLDSLHQLQKAADKAGCGPQVRAAALRFLETGAHPAVAPSVVAKKPARRKASSTWPLPAPADSILSAQAGAEANPHFDVLLKLALEEKRPDDVLHWYDQLTGGPRPRSFDWYGVASLHAEVADAVAATHPDRAIALYQQIIEGHVARTSPSAYEAARPYLRKLRDLLQRRKRQAEWSRYLAQLRDANHRKRRFLEVLDRLDNRRIVDG